MGHISWIPRYDCKWYIAGKLPEGIESHEITAEIAKEGIPCPFCDQVSFLVTILW